MLGLLQHKNKNHCPTLLIHNGSHCFNVKFGKGYLFNIFSESMKEFDILKCKNTHRPKYYILYSTGDKKTHTSIFCLPGLFKQSNIQWC